MPLQSERFLSLFAAISQPVRSGDLSYGQNEHRWMFSLRISVMGCKKNFELGNPKFLSLWPSNLTGLCPIILTSSPYLSAIFLRNFCVCVCEHIIITMTLHFVYWVWVIQRATPQTDTTNSHVTTSLADHTTLLCGSRTDCTDSFVRILMGFQPFVVLEVSCDE